MRKSALLGVCAGIAAVVLVCGCAGTGRGPSDEELIRNVLGKWKAAAEALDIEAQMALCSESLESDWGDKEATKEFMLDAKDMGYLDDMEVITDEAEITIDGNVATVYPLEVQTAMGGATVGLTLTKEAGGWIITELESEY